MVAGQGTQGAGLVSLQQTRTLASIHSWGDAGQVGSSAPGILMGSSYALLCP